MKNWSKFAFAVAAGVLTAVPDAHPQPAPQSFLAPRAWSNDFTVQRGWHLERHLRVLADVNGDHRQDVVGFGQDAVWIALSTGTAFGGIQLGVANFSYDQGWRVDKHVRVLADINNDGRADIVGFGETGVYTALS